MKISGAITALATPMKSDGTLDFSSLENLIEYQISEGINALVSVGTTGESATVDVEEHLEIIKFFIEVSNGRIPIICLLYTSPSPRDGLLSRMPSSA